jgi:hypothetical protein
MNVFSRTAFRNGLLVGGMLMLSTAYYLQDGFSNSGGITGITDKPRPNNPGFQPGCTCHSTDASNEVGVVISTEATTFVPGQTYRFKVTAAHPTAKEAGVNIEKFRQRDTSSMLSVVTGEGLRKSSFQLAHSAPKQFVDGSVSWEFDYTAPMTGVDTLYAVANAVNGNNSNDQGDLWNLAAKFVVAPTASVKMRSDLADNFSISPNPVRAFTRVEFNMKKNADLQIVLLDAAGREVMMKQLSGLGVGKGEAMLDLSKLSTGEYLVNVMSAGSLVHTGKILRIK